MADIFAVGVVGAGTMWAGVAEVAARAGHDVVLCSRSRASADATLAGIAANLDRQVSKGRLSGDERDSIVGRIIGTDSIAGLTE